MLIVNIFNYNCQLYYQIQLFKLKIFLSKKKDFNFYIIYDIFLNIIISIIL